MPDFLINEGAYESPSLEEAVLEYAFRGFNRDKIAHRWRWGFAPRKNPDIFEENREKFFSTKILSVLRIEEELNSSFYPGRKKFAIALDGSILDLEIWGIEIG